MDLTADQKATVAELQAELRDLHLESDARWKEYVKTGSQECYDAVLAIDSEVEMKALIAHVPKAGEGKVGKIKKLLDKVRGDAECPDCDLPAEVQARLDSLDTVNAWREEHGLPLLDRLPRGLMGDATDCVLARAFMPGDDKILLDGFVWQFAEVHIGGSGDNRLELYRQDPDGWNNIYRTIELPGSTAFDRVITTFDSRGYYDLVDEDALVSITADMIRDDDVDDTALQAVFEAGYVEDLLAKCEHYTATVKFEDGVFLIIDSEGGEHTYTVDTEFSMRAGNEPAAI